MKIYFITIILHSQLKFYSNFFFNYLMFNKLFYYLRLVKIKILIKINEGKYVHLMI